LNYDFFPQQELLTKEDYVIICGDFGYVWSGNHKEKDYRKKLNKKNFTTLFIDGNHENFPLLNSFPVEIWNGGKIHRIEPSVIHLMRGQVYTINGIKIFTFGGADSIDRIYRQEFISWWAEEMPSTAEFDEGLENLQKHKDKVDIIITHSCPWDILYNNIGAIKPGTSLEKYLQVIKSLVGYKHWYFGHFHSDMQIDEKHTSIYKKIIKI